MSAACPSLDGLLEDEESLNYNEPENVSVATMRSIIGLSDESKDLLLKSSLYAFSVSSPCPSVESLRLSHDTICRTISCDTFGTAQLTLGLGMGRCAVINMANEYNCVGGFERSWGSQEESLFHRSTLGYNLWPHRRTDDTRIKFVDDFLPRQEAYYPLTECGGIYPQCGST